MILLLFLIGLALGAESPSDDQEVKLQLDNYRGKLQRGRCPMFWWDYNDRCYKYVATHLTWAEAESYCLSLGTNLVSVHSEEEHHFVNYLIQKFDHAQGLTWIGLSDSYKEGTWMWSDGCPDSFVYWSPTQPDNDGGIQNCCSTNDITDNKWNDNPCNITLPSVCATRITCP